jgi:hypothetical protein
VAAYAATVPSTVAILAVLNKQIAAMAQQVETHFGQHPAAEIILSNRGWVRSLAPGCLPSSGTPMTGMSRRRPGRTTPVPARLPAPLARRKSCPPDPCTTTGSCDALDSQAFAALTASPGARAYYDRIRAREISHRAALRQLANRLVGILHGCLKIGTHYDEAIAWSRHAETVAA